MAEVLAYDVPWYSCSYVELLNIDDGPGITPRRMGVRSGKLWRSLESFRLA